MLPDCRLSMAFLPFPSFPTDQTDLSGGAAAKSTRLMDLLLVEDLTPTNY